jgi:hypothetical protein
MHDLFETFREMLAYSILMKYRLNVFPQQCGGFFSDTGGDVRAQLDPLMSSLGFKPAIPTGPCCALFDSPRAVLAMASNPSDYRPYRRIFTLAGDDAESLRRLLGEIALGSSLEVEIDTWLPPLE